ncbi:hypothetical protein H5410_019408 [Solanum commersonii]|uniref:Large ribosomal subunit protein bL32m n=1 Tax=Solanum commersonii TaxID=4109 RepID=A0A9J5Z8A3_SOLCO|nr:hypothetical protein H5410_019408 [Solanum commersonii]
MALRGTMLRTGGKFAGVSSNLRRFIHITSRPAPLDSVVDRLTATSPSLVLPENENNSNMFLNSPFNWGSMELMAVPKKKVSPHKRGIRNGPKALKPVPVIIRCKACGRVKLPHFFCCSGIKQNPGEENNSTG